MIEQVSVMLDDEVDEDKVVLLITELDVIEEVLVVRELLQHIEVDEDDELMPLVLDELDANEYL